MKHHKKTAPARAAFQRTFTVNYKKSSPAFQAVNHAALRALPALLSRWIPDGTIRGREYVARNPRRTDAHAGSFSININTGRWADFATGDRGGDVISLAAYLFDISQGESCKRISAMLGENHD